MSTVTPIRPGAEPPAPEVRRDNPIDDVHRHLLQSSAIADLLMIMPGDDFESLDTETVTNAMWCIKDRIEAARTAADAIPGPKEKRP